MFRLGCRGGGSKILLHILYSEETCTYKRILHIFFTCTVGRKHKMDITEDETHLAGIILCDGISKGIISLRQQGCFFVK